MKPAPASEPRPPVVASAKRTCARVGKAAMGRLLRAPAIVTFLVPSLGSCGYVLSQARHAFMRGTVVRMLDEHTAQVCLGDGEVEVGDRVIVFENDCRMPTPERNEPSIFPASDALGSCTQVELGSGVVEHLLNKHYSVVRFPDGVPVRAGATVDVR